MVEHRRRNLSILVLKHLKELLLVFFFCGWNLIIQWIIDIDSSTSNENLDDKHVHGNILFLSFLDLFGSLKHILECQSLFAK